MKTISLNFEEKSIDMKTKVTGIEAVLVNIRKRLLTEKGTYRDDLDYGTNLHDFICKNQKDPIIPIGIAKAVSDVELQIKNVQAQQTDLTSAEKIEKIYIDSIKMDDESKTWIVSLIVSTELKDYSFNTKL